MAYYGDLVESLAIYFFKRDVLDGKATEPADDTVKDKYRSLALHYVRSGLPLEYTNNYSYLIGGEEPNIPVRDPDTYGIAQYSDIPSLRPYIDTM